MSVKNWSVVAIFVVCSIGLFLTLAIGFPLKFVSPTLWRAWADMAKGLFCQLLMFVVSHTSPAKVRIYSKHENMKFTEFKNGNEILLKSVLSPRAVLMANHQIYTDWVYLWYLAASANLESAPQIILKESLKRVPIFGWAMQMFQFTFLSRNWAKDEQIISDSMKFFGKDKSWPLWMLLFPEGTVFTKNTYEKGKAYAKKASIPDALIPKHMLLPRIKGLHAVLRGIGQAVPVLYDVTTVYEPLGPPDTDVERFYSLGLTFIESKGPQRIKMYIREFPMSQVPFMESEEIFTAWIYDRWLEKDAIYRDLAAGNKEDEFRGEGAIEMQSLTSLFRCFNVPFTLILAVRLAYKYAHNR